MTTSISKTLIQFWTMCDCRRHLSATASGNQPSGSPYSTCAKKNTFLWCAAFHGKLASVERQKWNQSRLVSLSIQRSSLWMMRDRLCRRIAVPAPRASAILAPKRKVFGKWKCVVVVRALVPPLCWSRWRAYGLTRKSGTPINTHYDASIGQYLKNGRRRGLGPM